MGASDVTDYMRRNRWPIAFLVVIFAGYSVGKDLAQRDNARDRIAVQEAAR